MLHHASLEITSNQLGASVDFWQTVGFERVEPPADLEKRTVWVQRRGTQIHLVETADPTVPAFGHVAVVVPDFVAAVARLEAAGIRVESRREYWGEKRAIAIAPGGHRVELMAAPPGAVSG